MGLRGPLLDLDERRSSIIRPQLARSLRLALDRARWSALANDAQRSAALVHAYQQTRRWIKAEVLKAIVYVVRERYYARLKGAKSDPALQFSTAVRRNRRLTCDCERPSETLAGLRYLAFAILML